MTALPARPSVASVRPVVLALAPPAPGVSHGTTLPCLETLGGSRLIERLLGTLAEVGLPSTVVVAPHDAVTALRLLLGDRCRVIGSSGDRREALTAALGAADDDLLLLHDAERALTPASTVSEVLAALDAQTDAVLPVVAMTDSVKDVRPDGLRNIDRSTVVGMQSPRLLRREVLESALARPMPDPGSDAPGTPGAPRPTDTVADSPGISGGVGGGGGQRFDEILAALGNGAAVRTVHGSHSGFAVVDRLSLWQAQISLGLARDTSHCYGLARRA
ncbi:2-C-methyl-D-erythritol 4-phosphate cytidylyltransferase [Brachybacterium sp. 107]|uniref:2-C-methyl-D-erythritol 4-phosphate cytidylyltransferase n=1 Tax=Brachybacterium sp. 107 TaxID=3457736 RepID=UPI004034D095